MCQYTQYVIRLIIQHVCNMIQYRIHMIMIQYTREMLQCRLVTVTRWQYMVTQSAITFTRLVHNTHFPHSTCQSTQYFSIDTWHVILPSLPHTVCRYSRYWHTICINTHCHTVCVDIFTRLAHCMRPYSLDCHTVCVNTHFHTACVNIHSMCK